MAEYSKLIITDCGKEMLARVLETGTSINFSKIASSSAIYELNTLKSLTELSDIRQESMISNQEIENGKIKIEAAFDNHTLTNGYYMRTLGLYATDLTAGEILYAVTIELSGSCYLPASSETTVSGVNISFVLAIENAECVNLEVNPAAFATIKDTQRLKEEIDSIISDDMEKAFYSIFAKVREPEIALSESDIEKALNTPWDGQGSADVTAMSAQDIKDALNIPWNGESSPDETALSSEDIKKITIL